MFLKDYWQNLGQNRELRTRDTIKAAAAHWKLLSAQQRTAFQDRVAAERQRYTQEMARWKTAKSFHTRPASVYALFLKDQWKLAKTSPEARKSIGEMGRYCSRLWKGLTPEQKAPYVERFQRCQRRFRSSQLALKAGLNVDLERKLDVPEEYTPPEAAEIDDDEEEDFDMEDDEFA